MSRYIIWFVTVAGLAPVGFLSIWSLKSHALSARVRELAPEPGSVPAVTDASIDIGPSITKLRLSTETWPAVVTVCGIASVLVGMFVLLPGNPQRIYRNGLSRIGHYVERVLESNKEYASVIIAKPDGTCAVLVARRGRKVLLIVFSQLNMREVVDFFGNHGMTPRNELLSGNAEVESNTDHLEFVLSFDAKANAELIRALFRDVFGVGDSTGLKFTTTGF